jgi:Mce-associated membrane protein
MWLYVRRGGLVPQQEGDPPARAVPFCQAGPVTTVEDAPSAECEAEGPDAVLRDLTASWLRRAVAVLLDGALLGAVAFLAADVVPMSVPAYVPVPFGTPVPAASSWTGSGWMIALVLVMVGMQAWLGATPGKLTMGIAVVRDDDARPVGLLRTLLRLLAHVLDAILMIGYLRPLWHRHRRTFADSIARTVVLRTTRPLPLRLGRPGRSWSDDGPPVVLQAADVPPWRRVATWVATLVCAAGVAMGFGSAQTSGASSQSCSPVVVPAAGVAFDAAPAFGAGSVEVEPARSVETRLGIERPRAEGPASLVVRWEPGDQPLPDGATARFAVLDDDGGELWAAEGVLRGGRLTGVGDGGTVLTDGTAGFAAPQEVAERFGARVAAGSWQTSVVTIAEGAASVPALTLCSGWVAG